MTEEVMAMICYDFPSKWDASVRISGKTATRTLSGARDAVAILNKEYGEGSHWVEPLNWTWAGAV